MRLNTISKIIRQTLSYQFEQQTILCVQKELVNRNIQQNDKIVYACGIQPVSAVSYLFACIVFVDVKLLKCSVAYCT